MEQNKMFTSNWNDVVFQGRNELVFEGKNREYGAYVLRKKYNRTILVALTAGTIIFLLFVSIPLISAWLEGMGEEEVKIEKQFEINLDAPPPVDESEPPPPPPPPPPPVETTTKFVPPVVTDEDIPEEDLPPPQEEIVKSAAETQVGDDEGDIIIPPDPGTGVLGAEDNKVYTFVEQVAEFPGGQPAMFDFIRKNFQYPAMERENQIQGTVYVEFTVNKEGKISDVAIKRGIPGGPGLDREAVRVVKSMPPWNPAKQNGRPVTYRFVMPIACKLR